MRLKHFAVMFALTGTLLLYFISTLAQPTIIKLDQIPKFEGKNVIATGIVAEYYTTQYGSQLITIREYNTSVTVFLEGEVDLEYGDKIQAIGQVQKYEETWEIIVENIKDIKILEKWKNVSFPVWQLAQRPTKYLGLNVNVSGWVDAVYDKYFHLKDAENNNTLLVFYNTNPFLYSGKSVFVSGKFLFDEQNLRYILVVSEEGHGVFLKTEE
jgi:DNA/RNA endonuclease YhcR with UshA esterase domain